MKTPQLIAFGLLASSLVAPAQVNFNFAFNSGSTGSDGPLNVTTNTTLEIPTNGIFNYTTINISTGATLRFSRNLTNTPVYLLAQGDVTIAGTIDVSGDSSVAGSRVGGWGGPGGFDGGYPALNGLPPGDGYGPGGGRSGNIGVVGSCSLPAGLAGGGAYGSGPGYSSANNGNTYGSPLLVPLVGGSGGGGVAGLGGGGGGGAILLASSAGITVSGTIRANGGLGAMHPAVGGGCPATQLGFGSGGAIRLVAPVVSGNGALAASGGGPDGPESLGRIRVDSIDRRNVSFGVTGSYTVGTYMVTFPPSRLDIIEVGGTNIVEGSGPVAIQLLNDSPTNRTVTVQARNFNAMVTNLVVLTPENGPRSIYTNIIDNTANNSAAIGTVTVGLPVNTVVTISAWTR